MNKIQKARREESKQTEPVQKPVRISYQTYAYLKSLIDDQKEKLKREFQTACCYVKGQKAMDNAHKIFAIQYAKLEAVEKELYAAAQAAYRDHPNKEMREFWGLET